MTKIKLGIEKTMAGFFCLAALFFTLLKIFGIEDLKFLEEIEPYFLPYISMVIITLSYLFGTLVHLLIGFSLLPLVSYIERKLKLGILSSPDEQKGRIYYPPLVKFWQHGSERLTREFEIMSIQKELLKLFIVVTFLFGGSLGFWLWGKLGKVPVIIIWAATVIFSLFFFIAYREQRKQYIWFRGAILNEFKHCVTKDEKTSSKEANHIGQ